MDKRINCNICPLRNVEVDMLCEDYCSDMADYREQIRANTIEEYTEWLKTQIVGIDKNISVGISSIYNNIGTLNDLFLKYNEIKDDDDDKKLQILTEINQLRKVAEKAIKNIIYPEVVVIDYKQSDAKYIASSENKSSNTASKIANCLQQVIDEESNLLTFLKFGFLEDKKFAEKSLKLIDKNFQKYLNKQQYKFTKICSDNEAKALVLFYVVPTQVFEVTLSSEKLVSEPKTYTSYFDNLPTLLKMDYMSPQSFEMQIRLKKFNDISLCFNRNIYNSNFCYFIIDKCLKYNCLDELMKVLIDRIPAWMCISFFNKARNYCKAAGGEYDENKNIRIYKVLGSLKEDEFEEKEDKELVKFIVSYCKSYVDQKVYEYNCDEKHPFALLLNTLYSDMPFTPRFYNKTLELTDKKELINMLLNHKDNIEKCRNKFIFGEDYLNDKDLKSQTRNMMFALINRLPDIYEKLKELGYKNKDLNYKDSLFNVANESIKQSFSGENPDVLDYTGYYDVAFTISFIFASNYDASKILTDSTFENATNQIVKIAEESKNTILQELYYSIYVKWYLQAYFGLRKAMRTITKPEELENIIRIQDELDKHWNKHYTEIRAVSSKTLTTSKHKSELNYQLDAYQYESFAFFDELEDKVKELAGKKARS